MARPKGTTNAKSFVITVSFKVSQAALLKIEAASRKKGYSDRSEYIRAALKAFQQGRKI